MATLSPILKQATPVVVDYAAGSWIHATDGKKYLDFTTGIGVGGDQRRDSDGAGSRFASKVVQDGERPHWREDTPDVPSPEEQAAIDLELRPSTT